MRAATANHIYLLGLILYISIRGRFGARTKTNEKIVSRAPPGDRVLVGLVFLGSIVLPATYLFSPWLRFADYHLPSALMWCGVAVMILALWLFWRAHADLGLNWSITLELRKQHELITRGVYRRVRHPMYSAIFLFALAQGFLLSNWLAGWAGFVSFASLYFLRVRREEEMMCEKFGESYRAYMRRAGRLWPLTASGRLKG